MLINNSQGILRSTHLLVKTLGTLRHVYIIKKYEYTEIINYAINPS